MAVFANLRKGGEEMKKAAASGGKGGTFVPNLRWKDDGEKHYVLFLSGMDDIPTVLYHKMMDCGTNPKTNKPMWRDFISRRDPNIDGPSGYDPLADRGYSPSNRSIAIVCEMEPVLKGGKIVSFKPMERTFNRKTEDGGSEEVTEPAIYLVIESPSTFFPNLRAFADEIGPIEDQVFCITRQGKDQNTTYAPIAYTGKEFEMPENVEEAEKRLEAYVEELASEDRMREIVESLPEDHVFNKYAKMKGGSAKSTSTKSSSSSAGRFSGGAKVADDMDGDDAEPKAEAPAAKPKKRSRFEELQAELTGNQ